MSGSASEPNLTLKCCGSILVRDHILWANTKSLHFWWSLTGRSTVSDYVSHFKVHSIIAYVFVIRFLEFQWNWCKQRWLCISWGDPRNKIWRSSATSGWSSGRRRGRRGGNRSIRAPWRRRRKITDWRFGRWGWKNGSYSHWTLMNTWSAFGVKLRANGRNNSQHCWPNNVSATTPNNTQQTDATCNIQRCWELLANYVASVWPGYPTIANSVNHTRTSIKRPLAEFCSKRSRPRVTLLCQ